jgi:hypothetical protein
MPSFMRGTAFRCVAASISINIDDVIGARPPLRRRRRRRRHSGDRRRSRAADGTAHHIAPVAQLTRDLLAALLAR